MTNQEKEKYIVMAIEDLNKYKHLDITLDKCIPFELGMKIDINASKMFCPASCFIINKTFDTSAHWEHDDKAGVNKLMDRPDGLNVDVCVKLRVAYMVYKLYKKFCR